MRIERLIYSVLVLLAAIIAIVNWRRAALFKADNEELRSRVEMLESESATAERLMDVTRENSQKVRAQAAELTRLRQQVTQLRDELAREKIANASSNSVAAAP